LQIAELHGIHEGDYVGFTPISMSEHETVKDDAPAGPGFHPPF